LIIALPSASLAPIEASGNTRSLCRLLIHGAHWSRGTGTHRAPLAQIDDDPGRVGVAEA